MVRQFPLPPRSHAWSRSGAAGSQHQESQDVADAARQPPAGNDIELNDLQQPIGNYVDGSGPGNDIELNNLQQPVGNGIDGSGPRHDSDQSKQVRRPHHSVSSCFERRGC